MCKREIRKRTKTKVKTRKNRHCYKPKKIGISLLDIMKATGLSAEEIENL